MAITKINSLAIPAGTVEPADIGYPLTNFSSTGIDDNATTTLMTLDSGGNVSIGGGYGNEGSTLTASGSISADLTITSGYALQAPRLYIDTDTLVVDPTNNRVGIGITSPTAQLHLSKAGGTTVKLGTSQNTSEIEARESGSANLLVLSANNSTDDVTINSSGQVGIGTAAPNQRLHVYENALGVNIKVENNDGAYEIQKYSDDIYLNLVDTGDVIWRLGTSLPERLRFTSAGNVNIGDSTNHASSKLYVNNSITTNYSGTIGMRYNVSGATNNYYKGISGTQIGLNQTARGLAIFNYDNDSNAGICFYPAAYPGISGNPNPSVTIDSAGTLQTQVSQGTAHITNATNSATIANNGTVDFALFSGMIIGNNHNTGDTTIWICGGTGVQRVSSTASGYGSFSYNSSIGGYTWTNNTGSSRVMTFMTFKTRNYA